MSSLTLSECMHGVGLVLGQPFSDPMDLTDIDMVLLLHSRQLAGRADVDAIAGTAPGPARQEMILKLVKDATPEFPNLTTHEYAGFVERIKILKVVMNGMTMNDVKDIRTALLTPPKKTVVALGSGARERGGNALGTLSQNSIQKPTKRAREVTPVDGPTETLCIHSQEKDRRELIEAILQQRTKEVEKKEKFSKEIAKCVSDAKSEDEGMRRVMAVLKKGW